MISGAEVAVKEITDKTKNCEFDLYCARLDKNLLKKEKIGNVLVRRIGIGHAIDKFLLPFFGFFNALKEHQKNPYNLVWGIIASHGSLAALFFKLKTKTPFLLTLQEGDSLEHINKRTRFFKPLFRKIFQEANYIQAISHYLGNWAKEQGAKCQIEIVPNGVDNKLFSQEFSDDELDNFKKELNIKKEEKVIITTSRLVKKNAIDDVIKAMGELKTDFELKFLIIGKGAMESSLKKLTKDLGLENQVLFLDYKLQKDLPKYLKISDIFIRPSLSEGFGNSFIEAMAAGLPVIAAPVGGIVDFVRDGETGLFCQTNNPESIAEKIRLLLSDKDLCQKLAANGKELAKEKYDWHLISEQMSNIFAKL